MFSKLDSEQLEMFSKSGFWSKLRSSKMFLAIWKKFSSSTSMQILEGQYVLAVANPPLGLEADG